MQLADLETFLTVVRERSFSRAAEKLHRTQPAVSLAVRRLEESCGETLFDRASKEPRMTDAGELVAARAEQMLNQRERLRLELLELRDRHSGKVTVGANESTAFSLLPVIESFRSRFPQIKLEVRRSLSRNLPSEILAGNLDFGVASYEPVHADIETTVVYHDRLVFIVYPDHPLASRPAINIQELGQESFIAHNVESPYRAMTIEAFRHHRVPLNIDLEMPTIESIKRLVMRRLGVAFVPRMSVAEELDAGTLREVPIRQLRVERPLRLVFRRRGQLSHAARAFFDVATERAREVERGA